MLREKISTERSFYKNMICQKLSHIRDKFPTNNIYLDQRSEDIILTLMSGSEIFGTGLTDLYTKNTIKQKEINKIVVVTYFSETGRAQIQRFLHLFSEVFILNLTISDQQTKKSMKVSPIRKKLKGFIEISINFIPFIDSVYIANKNNQKQSNTEFQQALSSYLVSLPKFYEYQIYHRKKESETNLADKIQQILKSKLQILQKHESSAFTEVSSPRIKVLLLNRSIEAMSPLVYSFFFGPISKELNLLNEVHQFTTNSMLYATLFSMDIQQSSEFLQKLISQKAQNQKLKFQLHQFQKAKQAISMHYDQSISSKEIQIQIEQLSQIKQFCKKKITTCSLQQTIINNRSQEDQKMSPSKIINKIVSWLDVPLEVYKPSLDDYLKILLLSYMVNSFWFFQRRIINAVIKAQKTFSEEKKEKIIKFCKKIENKYTPLKQKPQQEQRYDLYRHQPEIIKVINSWFQNNVENNFSQKSINKTVTKKQNRVVIAFKGPLGYNQLAFIFNYLKKKQQKYDVTIFCQNLVTNEEYLKILFSQNIS